MVALRITLKTLPIPLRMGLSLSDLSLLVRLRV